MQPTKFKVIVNDNKEFEFNSEQAKGFDIIKRSENEFHILSDQDAYHAELTAKDFQHRQFSVRIGTNNYHVRIENDLDALIAKMGYAASGSKRLNSIQAPMPGVILETRVSEGQEVFEGDVLLILEAMKMENTILSPRDAVIKKVHIEPGATVDKNTLLIELQ